MAIPTKTGGSTTSSSDKKKLIATGVMFSLAALLLAYYFGLFGGGAAEAVPYTPPQEFETEETQEAMDLIEEDLQRKVESGEAVVGSS